MGNNAKLLIATLVGTIVLVVGVSVFFSQPSSSETAGPVDQATLVEGATHTKGPENAPVTIVEFADFECPACAYSAPIVNDMLEGYPNVRFVYRHFPLITIHRNAVASAQAAEASSQQGKFWEMHDALYRTQEEWSGLGDPSEFFLGLARELQLDEAAFQAAYQDEAVENLIYRDLRLGERLKVNSTPTFYYNGEPVDLTTMALRLSEDFPEDTQIMFDAANDATPEAAGAGGGSNGAAGGTFLEGQAPEVEPGSEEEKLQIAQ